MARQLLSTIAIGAAVALLAPASAVACSCVPLGPAAVRGADAAVIAKLKRVRADEDGSEATFVYRVRHALVGRRLAEGDRLKVRSALDSAACGLPRERRRYGLVLGRSHGRWSASLCSQTTPKALRKLARGKRARDRYC